MRLFTIAEQLKCQPFPRHDAQIPEKEPDYAGLIAQSGLPAETADALLAAAEEHLSGSAVKWYLSWLSSQLFRDKLDPEQGAEWIPDQIGILSEEGNYAFFAMLALCGFPSRQRSFIASGLPEESWRGALEDLSLWIAHFRKNRGITGIAPSTFRWEHRVLNASPLTLGRLQFRLQPFAGKVQVYRRRSDGFVQAFASAGVRCNRSGQLDGVDGEFDPVAWNTVFSVTPDAISGNPLTPSGRILQEHLTLNAAEWIPVLREGDLVLDTHIPENGVLDPAECARSMRRGWEFFTSRYPERKIRGFSCASWLLDPQYEMLLRPDSRILAFLRQYYLFPTLEGGSAALWRIFGEDGLKDGPEHAPQTTSMQRNVADFLLNGGKLRGGGGFFLAEDLDRYGAMPYRNQIPATTVAAPPPAENPEPGERCP